MGLIELLVVVLVLAWLLGYFGRGRLYGGGGGSSEVSVGSSNLIHTLLVVVVILVLLRVLRVV